MSCFEAVQYRKMGSHYNVTRERAKEICTGSLRNKDFMYIAYNADTGVILYSDFRKKEQK